jgi:hypothetical protein
MFGKLVGSSRIKPFWEDPLAGWWRRKFPRRPNAEPRGFDVFEQKSVIADKNNPSTPKK